MAFMISLFHLKGFLGPSSREPFSLQSQHVLYNQLHKELYILYIQYADISIIIIIIIIKLHSKHVLMEDIRF